MIGEGSKTRAELPLRPLLRRAQKGDLALVHGVKKMARTIARDGWEEFLVRVYSGKMTAIFKYIEKADGRNPRRFKYSCADTVIDDNVLLLHLGGDKSKLLAGHFCRPLPIRERLAGADPLEDTSEEKEMQRLHRTCAQECREQGEFREFTLVEVAKVVRGMALGRPRGPDGM